MASRLHTPSLSRDDWLNLLHLAHADKSRGFQLYRDHYQRTDGGVYWSDALQFTTYINGYHQTIDRHYERLMIPGLALHHALRKQAVQRIVRRELNAGATPVAQGEHLCDARPAARAHSTDKPLHERPFHGATRQS